MPQVNLINGGKHASNELDFQEFILMPVGVATFADALAVATEVNLALREILAARYGQVAVNTGDEGGFAPPISEPAEALEQLHLAVDRAAIPAWSSTAWTVPPAISTTRTVRFTCWPGSRGRSRR